MRPTEVPDLNIGAVSAAYLRRVEAACPGQVPLAARVLDRLEPARWMLEWYLPWWLGEAFGVAPDLSRTIVLSNVLGLASIRLRDDLADGEVDRAEVADSEILSAALYDEAVAVYRGRFDGSSPFWGQLATYMSEWQAANHEGEGGATHEGESAATHEGPTSVARDIDTADRRARRGLARHGAPLKIAAFAMYLLAGRADRFPDLDRCLDHALTALVLYDHLCDWEADLVAGRWNAFIAGTSGLLQSPRNRVRNRSGVLVALMTTDAPGIYVADIQVELARAITAAETLPLEPLAEHLRGFATQVSAQGITLQAHYRDLAERATKVVFGPRASALRQGGLPVS